MGHALKDEDIVAGVLDGHTALFEILMRRHNERIYRAARAILRDDSEAEDVMQQAYVNAYAHLRQFNGRAQFSTWLTRIAINEALARVRRKRNYLVRRRRHNGRGVHHGSGEHSRIPGTSGRGR